MMENNNSNNSNYSNNSSNTDQTNQTTNLNTSSQNNDQQNHAGSLNHSGQESSSSYSYSYVNQEQKNPNNIWRAEENTANYTESADYQKAQNANNAYGNYTNNSYNNMHDSSNGQNNSYAGGQSYSYANAHNSTYHNGQDSSYSTQNNQYNHTAQTGTNTDYSNVYGQANTNSGGHFGWKTSDEQKKMKKEERARKRAEKAANTNPSFAIKLAKCASIALVFGLVAGTAFEGSSFVASNYLFGNEKEEASATENKKESVIKNTDSSEKTASALPVSSGASSDVTAITKACMPSIVAITNLSEVEYRNFFGQVQRYETPSAGSGIIISENDDYLYIVTNNHVVEGATTLTIQFVDDSTAGAEVKGTDKSADLAVVQVKKSDIEADTLAKIELASFGDSDEIEVGSQAIAIGNALGYGQSVTTGVVSAVEREVTIQDESTGESFTNDLIQTDAAINPGNSGGALLNNKGEVIGINSSKYSDTNVEGMGFAIPSNMAKPIIEDLITREIVSDEKAAYLGISGADVNSTIAETYGMPEGALVTEVSKGTAADKYGLKKGDIITKFDGKVVKSMESLRSRMAYYQAGDEVEVTIQRMAEGGYQEQVLKIVLDKKNS